MANQTITVNIKCSIDVKNAFYVFLFISRFGQVSCVYMCCDYLHHLCSLSSFTHRQCVTGLWSTSYGQAVSAELTIINVSKTRRQTNNRQQQQQQAAMQSNKASVCSDKPDSTRLTATRQSRSVPNSLSLQPHQCHCDGPCQPWCTRVCASHTHTHTHTRTARHQLCKHDAS